MKKTFKQILIKASYPLLGNLSNKWKSRLEDKLGKNLFCAEAASVLSWFANPVLYPLIANNLFQDESVNIAVCCYGILESVVRARIDRYAHINSASLLGKLVSIYFGRNEC